MTTLATQFVTSDGSSLTLSGVFLFLAIFVPVMTIILGMIDYIRRH